MSLTSSELDATSSPRHTPHSLTRSLKLPAATAGEAPGHHHVSPTTMSKTHNQNMRTQQLTRRSSVTKVPPPVYPEPAMMNPRYLHILSKEPFNILQPGWRWNPREQSHELVYKCPCGGHVQMTWNLSPRSNVALLRHLDVNKTMKHAKYCEMMQNQRRNASPAAGNDPGY